MACKQLSSGSGIPFLWNVSSKVGDTKECINSPTDVELVNFLLDFITSKMESRKIQNRGITVNGTFDIATGYWIYYLQFVRRETKFPECKVDGVISPAKYFDPRVWTIAYFNGILFNQDPKLFNNLDKYPMFSPALKADLSKVKR